MKALKSRPRARRGARLLGTLTLALAVHDVTVALAQPITDAASDVSDGSDGDVADDLAADGAASDAAVDTGSTRDGSDDGVVSPRDQAAPDQAAVDQATTPDQAIADAGAADAADAGRSDAGANDARTPDARLTLLDDDGPACGMGRGRPSGATTLMLAGVGWFWARRRARVQAARRPRAEA